MIPHCQCRWIFFTDLKSSVGKRTRHCFFFGIASLEHAAWSYIQYGGDKSFSLRIRSSRIFVKIITIKIKQCRLLKSTKSFVVHFPFFFAMDLEVWMQLYGSWGRVHCSRNNNSVTFQLLASTCRDIWVVGLCLARVLVSWWVSWETSACALPRTNPYEELFKDMLVFSWRCTSVGTQF